MVARRRFHCVAIEVANVEDQIVAREVLPWADPYIAGLVRRLRNEILAESETAPPATERVELPAADADDEAWLAAIGFDEPR